MSSLDTSMEEGDSFLSNTDAVIYGTSDHSGWGGDSMISDPNIVLSSTSTDEYHQQQISTAAGGGSGGDDLIVELSSGASSSWVKNDNMHSNHQQEIRIFNVDFRATSGSESSNRLKSFAGSELSLGLNIGGLVNYETSDKLVKTLTACAEAVQQNNLKLADALVRYAGILAAQQSGAKKKVATYFTRDLERRIHETNAHYIVESSYNVPHFYETCRDLEISHFTTNQTILQAFANYDRVHVIDISMSVGLQWRALMHALALRPGGPPTFRFTHIASLPYVSKTGPTTDRYELAELAESIGVEFESGSILCCSLTEVNESFLEIRPRNLEAVAVNLSFMPYHIMRSELKEFIHSIEKMQPIIVTSFEKKAANYNGNVFLNSFNEAWHYYSTMFDFLEKKESTHSNSGHLETVEKYFGQQIYNMVTETELGSSNEEENLVSSVWLVIEKYFQIVGWSNT